MKGTYVAVDFGASNGRVIAGQVVETPEGKDLIIKEIHRFPNNPVRIGETLYWDFPGLFSEMKKGLAKAAAEYSDIVSIGIDSWGVDFGLIDKNGNLIGNPICYRDQATMGEIEDFAKTFDLSEHYAETGIQILPINTLFRLRLMARHKDPRLKIAGRLLFMPDLFSFYLTGVAGNEYTISSTSELLLAKSRQWNRKLIETIGIDPNLFGEIVMPGDFRGNLLRSVSEETGLNTEVKIIAVGSHDTASAVFAMAEHYRDTRSAFLSSGTWSLLGALVETPIMTEEARLAGYTNEGAVEGQIRLLTNMTGLWPLQQLMGEWRKKEKEEINWEMLIKEAEKSSDTAIIDLDAPLFQDPVNMEGKIISNCKGHGLKVPSTKGEFVRCICKSLAWKYKTAIEKLNILLPDPIKRLIIFGGGSKNRLLTRFTAEMTGLEIIVKDAEATSIGNLLLQAIARGEIKNKNEIKKNKFI